MGKKFIHYFAGFMTAAAIFGAATAFAETAATVDVIFGRVTLVVNGVTAEGETMLYDGSTYVPIRTAAELLGMAVDFDQDTATAYLSTEKREQEPAEITRTPLEGGAPPVTAEDLLWTVALLEESLLEQNVMEAVITNNGQHPLLSVQLLLADGKTGEVVSIVCQDTLMPGESSEALNAFGPAGGDAENLMLAEVNYTFIDGDSLYDVNYNEQTGVYSHNGPS